MNIGVYITYNINIITTKNICKQVHRVHMQSYHSKQFPRC